MKAVDMKYDATFIDIRDSKAEDVTLLRANLRMEDANEILRFGISIERGLWRSYRNSTYRKSVFVDGELIAMFGIQGGFLGDKGVIWLMTCTGVNKISPLRFCRIYMDQVAKMRELYPYLCNYVDAEHIAAIRLLENAGFSVGNPEPFGYDNNQYCKFEIGN